MLVGFAPLRRLEHREKSFREWIAEGRAAEMEWLSREPERRFDPRNLDPRLRSVVSLAYPYDAPAPPPLEWRVELRGRIAAYALGPDYHTVVLARARAVAAAIDAARPGAVTRAYVDTGPVFEREWAVGGRPRMVRAQYQSPQPLSWFVFFSRRDFHRPRISIGDRALSRPLRRDAANASTCARPSALGDGYLLEPRLCISYLTIEHRGPIPIELRPKLGNWIFGCDICQEVCPWNVTRLVRRDRRRLAPALRELMALDDEGFRRRYGKSAIRRTKRRGLLRNAAVALGNSGNPRRGRDSCANASSAEPEALVRSHAAWALGQTRGARRRASRSKKRARREMTRGP